MTDPAQWPTPTWAKLIQPEPHQEKTMVNQLFDELNEIATAYAEEGQADELLESLLVLRDNWANILGSCKCDHIRASVVGCPVHPT